MIRTQISLEKREYDRAKREARALGISIAEYVRRALQQATASPRGPAWMRFAGMVESGDSRSSQSVDEVVYGPKD